MPLPDGGKMSWPPQHMRGVYDEMSVLSAWYAGDPELLSAVYGGTVGASHPFFQNSPSQYRGGVVGTVARWWWGNPTPVGEPRSKIHVPIASDIATMSADLLFSEAPKLRVGNKEAQTRLDDITSRGNLHPTLLEGAEVASALSGAYLVVTWDDAVADHPWIRSVHPDAAVPEFRWDRLAAVTLWRVVEDADGAVWRHLERYEPGRIEHGLYEGSIDRLGVPRPLSAHDATAALQPEVAVPGKRLAAAYVPNMRPNRLDRSSPMGRSDFGPGVLSLMDSLDEVLSSWMRDVDLGKARLIVPNSMLQSRGRGQGASFDLDRRLFTGVESAAGLEKGTMPITEVQFKIRYEEHANTFQRLVAEIVRGCGYSEQSFGASGDVAVTATEVHARERKSFITRDKKALYWRNPLADAIETLLIVDAELFGSGVTPERPIVEFGDSVQEQPKVLAETANLLNQAMAASIETRVRTAHPDWDDGRVDREVIAIKAEQGQPSDPTAMGGVDPLGLEDDPDDGDQPGQTDDGMTGDAADQPTAAGSD